MQIYETIHGFSFPLDRLSEKERRVFRRLYALARKRPDWSTFTNRWWPMVRDCYAGRRLSPRQITKQPLYHIAQDLEARLAISQRKAAAPDYRADLKALLERLHVSSYKLSRKTRVSQGMLSHVFHRRKNLSMEALEKVLDAVGYRISFAPKVSRKPIESAVSTEN